MKKIISVLLLFIITITILLGQSSLIVHADESKILTLGANLTEEQKQLVIDYLGVDTTQVVVIEVNNQDEHNLLDNIATQQQIGTRTFSCSYIEPTSFGGIHIKTVNLNWVTCEMIRNALVTSGIVNCNIVCISPIEVSGTGALTGIFKAYETVSNVEITEESKELASEELVITCEIAEVIGQEEASSMLSELKEEIITSEISNEEDIEQVIRAYIEKNELEVDEEDFWRLLDLLIKISKQDYDIEEVKQAYVDIKQTVSEIQEATEKTVGFFEGIANWFKGIWNWFTGKAKEIEESEQAKVIKDSIGILAETNDSLLSDSTVVTNTVDDEVLEEISTDETDETSTEDDKKPWYQFIFDIFNAGNKSEDTNSDNIEDESSENESESEVNFDTFKEDSAEYQEELDNIQTEDIDSHTDSEEGLLQYIKPDFENTEGSDAELNDNSNTCVKSFNDLTN